MDARHGLREAARAYGAQAVTRPPREGERIFHIDDVSEIPFLQGIVGMEFYQLRARVRAGQGDLFAATCPEVPGYEPYNRDRLGLGASRFVLAPPVGAPSAVAKACAHGAAFETLCEQAVADGSLLIHPYMGATPVWELARALADGSGVQVRVLGPPPPITWYANDKGHVTELARALLGDGVLGGEPVVETVAATTCEAIAAGLSDLARRHRAVGLKKTRCASSMGNLVFPSADLLAMAPSDVAQAARSFLETKAWEPGETILVVAWETAESSPSTQLWIPPAGHGPPRLEGVYEQILEGPECLFWGSVPSRLGADVDGRVARASLRMASAYQELGYVGRCSFDFIVVDGQARVVECNGRWGGTSTPMHLVDRLFPAGRPAYRARDYVDEALRGVPFDAILDALGTDLYDARTGQGRFVLYNVGCLDSYGKFDVIAFGTDLDAADRALEEGLPEALSRGPW